MQTKRAAAPWGCAGAYVSVFIRGAFGILSGSRGAGNRAASGTLCADVHLDYRTDGEHQSVWNSQAAVDRPSGD